MKHSSSHGFTLIEILIVISLIAILATVVLIAINPGKQFAQARNSQRLSNINALLNAINQNMADNRGTFVCTSVTSLPSTTTLIASAAGIDLRPCLIPTYINEIPVDPEQGTFVSGTDYSTGYTISQDSSSKRITIAAPSAELNQKITATR
jgi:prepilin-type N-terminal cleavage/methylation domain-containing protein